MIRNATQCITLCAALVPGLVSAGETMVISSWGGAYQESQHRAYVEPFIERNPGLKVLWEAKSHNALSILRAQSETGTYLWDVVDIMPDEAQVACDEGLLEPIDPQTMLEKGSDGSPPSQDFLPGALSECFVATVVYSNVIAYHNDSFGQDKPQSIADVFDIERFPGKRAFERTPFHILEWALVADGVTREDIYTTLATDAGVARAFAKLDTIKPHIVWWEVGAQPPQLLANKEVAFTSAYNGRIFHAQVKEQQPFTILWDSQVQEFDGWSVPKGKLTARTREFLRFSTDTQRLADQAQYISYGPARRSSDALVTTHADTGVAMQPHLPTNPANAATAITKNIAFWTDNLDQLRQTFEAWLQR